MGAARAHVALTDPIEDEYGPQVQGQDDGVKIFSRSYVSVDK